MHAAPRAASGAGRRNIEDCVLTAEDLAIFRQLQAEGAYDLSLEKDRLVMLMSEHQDGDWRAGERDWLGVFGDESMSEQCRAHIYVRDTYRRTGRGKTGFELHYARKQCARKAGACGYCWQHAAPAQTTVSGIDGQT